MKVRYTYRLRPGATAQRYLMREWGMCRYVWNQLVAETKARRETAPDTTFGYADQDKHLTHLRATTRNDDGDAWLAAGSSVAQQQTVRDFAASRSKALLDRKNRIPVAQRHGMPRFKSRHTSRPTLNYTTRGFSLKTDDSGRGRLVLPGRVAIPVVWSRNLPSAPKSVRVSQDTLGHWYASFVVEVDAAPLPAVGDGQAIGVDWGVRETATTARLNLRTGAVDETTSFDLSHTEHGKHAAAELARAQKAMARRRRPRGQAHSHGYRLARFKAAKIAAKIARQRKDDARKWAKALVEHHDHIAVEDFRPRFLASTSMARKAADGAIAVAKAELVWQATKAGRDLRLVAPANTTTDCGNCGARAKHRLPLGERTYTCEACGYVRPRDKNSAIVMIARAGFDPADVEGVSPGSALAADQAA